MNSTMTIFLEAQGPLLTAQVRGFAEDLLEGTRAIDAIAAECARVGADRAIADFSDLGGSLASERQPELERYASARFGRVKCALVLPPECIFGGPPSPRAKVAVFADPSDALDWMRGRTAMPLAASPPPRHERTLVHLL